MPPEHQRLDQFAEQAEGTPLPRNGFVQTDQSSGDAGNGSLASTVCRRNVEVDAARKVEAALDRSRDWSGQFDTHGALRDQSVRRPVCTKTSLYEDQSARKLLWIKTSDSRAKLVPGIQFIAPPDSQFF